MSKDKIILFGGSFDPIHNGHICVARYAAEYIGAGEVIFIAANCSPHKQHLILASGADRQKMIELATAGHKNMRVSDCELKREPPSYTIDTVRYFRQIYGKNAGLYWLLGGDMLVELPRWHNISELLDECNLCLMVRPGAQNLNFEVFSEVFGVKRVDKLKKNIIPNPPIDISSTEIRRRVAAGEDISKMTPPAVAAYIKEKGLYR